MPDTTAPDTPAAANQADQVTARSSSPVTLHHVTSGSISPAHTLIGALAGLTEVSLMQPTVAIKNALQEGRPLPRTPAALYRGLLINAGAMFPITATQFGMNRLLEQTYNDVLGSAPGNLGKIGVAAAAGTTSAFLGCPAEYLMIQQQRHNRALGPELRHTIGTHGLLGVYRGINATIVRESLYASCYLGLMPLMQARLQAIPAVNDLPGGPLVVSGLAAGLLATVSTQPADTIKTRMQAFPDKEAHPEYRSIASTGRHIVATEGVGTLWAGLAPRAFRIVCAVFILTATRTACVDFLEERRRAPVALELEVEG